MKVDFDECIKEAKKAGRKYMLNPYLKKNEVSTEEWYLAIAMYIIRSIK